MENIGHAEDGRDIIRFIHNAKHWSIYDTSKYFDPVLQKLFDKGFGFTERREQEIRRTSEEVLLNCYSACEERTDLFVEYIVYFGRRGIAIHVKDEGPGFNHAQKLRETRQKKDQPTDEILLYGDDLPGNSGLLCLLRYTNEFHHNKKGNEVIMKFDLSK
ncbi:ATP-binding protein [Candidatus Woesearchaeota archaeon]|nr:ATP-binding protein [Candidatus Woesearchaeota archaeon]